MAASKSPSAPAQVDGLDALAKKVGRVLIADLKITKAVCRSKCFRYGRIFPRFASSLLTYSLANDASLPKTVSNDPPTAVPKIFTP